MIVFQGQLVIKTRYGRFGEFNVGTLVTEIGEFVVKDAVLDQYSEGKYRGEFVIKKIAPAFYTSNNRVVTEIRAYLDSMTLSNQDELSIEDVENVTVQEIDPVIDEISPAPITSSSKTADSEFINSTQKEELLASVNDDKSNHEDKILFGILWPLGNKVKLDSTIDRVTLRKQLTRLNKLGYIFDPLSQVWSI